MTKKFEGIRIIETIQSPITIVKPEDKSEEDKKKCKKKPKKSK